MASSWQGLNKLTSKEFTCGFCGNKVASADGYYDANTKNSLRICPHCGLPTLFDPNGQFPKVAPGNPVQHVPDDVSTLYEEARKAAGGGAYTSAVLTCRKLLMHIAVAEGAAEGLNFLAYVDDLAGRGYVPPRGRAWVDHIRKKGNEANHEIKIVKDRDAEELISFCEMLLKFIYEFPSRVPVEKPLAA